MSPTARSSVCSWTTSRSTSATGTYTLTSASSTCAPGPRAGSSLGSALVPEFFSDHWARVVLVHSTRESGLRMAAGMDHVVEGPSATQTSAESAEDLGRVTVATELEPGQRLRLVKFLGYGW